MSDEDEIFKIMGILATILAVVFTVAGAIIAMATTDFASSLAAYASGIFLGVILTCLWMAVLYCWVKA